MSMTLKEICERLKIVEKQKTGVIRDNMQISMLRLLMFTDGSGEVQADWSHYRPDMCKEEKTLHRIFTTESPLFEFSKPEELEAWLEEQTGKG